VDVQFVSQKANQVSVSERKRGGQQQANTTASDPRGKKEKIAGSRWACQGENFLQQGKKERRENDLDATRKNWVSGESDD